MKVILTQTVPGLGEAGAIKEVADGYARNYLLPKKLATTATRGSMKQAEAQAGVFARRASKAASEAQQAASAVEGKTVTIRARVGSENRLYGSVTAADVADALQQQYGIQLDRRKIELGEAIHRTGTYSATADLGQGVSTTFTVEVAPEVAGAHGRASRATEATAEAAPAAQAEAASVAEAEVEPVADTAAETEAEPVAESVDAEGEQVEG
jgi:large subunit ribosomal protein L9